ncbi:WD repeat-containing protein 55 homolog isoform X2 [Anopheles cruzii]|uniref:WD repeat-containing protein 55 homolog isoform X1 n=1 Tax=Anopheles cruzii TaxID=68878 RepID=UPI0022EC6DDD|nr:WD repeat-containing protein 55 homolog isoform X1 [Anopheles cruzii]XP_052866243.1 WD repeat-containing protein 55 homolog isoform X2 [Anopheles cruzii]
MRNFQSPHFNDALSENEDEDLTVDDPYLLEQFGGPDEQLGENDTQQSIDMEDDSNNDSNDSDFTIEAGSDNEDDGSDASMSNEDSDPSIDGSISPTEPSTEDETDTPHRAIDDYDEEMEEDEVVKAIIAEIKKPRSKPPDIQTDDFVIDLSFHPREDLLAIGTSVGDVLFYRYGNEENKLEATHELHTKSVRCVEFSRDGRSLITTGRERSIVVTDVATGKMTHCWEAAHEEPVYSMANIGAQTFATGDDNGTLKLWDVRQKEPVFSLHEVEDFISSICTTDRNQKYLLMTSGDGMLTAINIAQRRLYIQSEPYEEEMNCMGLFKRASKLVVGTSKGNYYTFNWEQFGYHCDAFSGPKPSANRMVPITDQIAVMAGEDGVIRAMHMIPGRMLGIVGQHSMAVDTMDISGSGELIATSSHDNDVRFWNVKYFEDFDDIQCNSRPDKRAMKHNLPSSQRTNTRDFFADMNVE